MVFYKKSFTDYLTTSNSWILIISIIFIAFARIMTFRDGHYSMVYLNSNKWELFIEYALSMLLLLSPLLLFSIFRNSIKDRFSPLICNILWFVAFLVLPFLVGASGMSRGMSPVSMDPEVFWMLTIPIIIIELMTSPKSKWTIGFDFSKWKERISLEWIVVGGFVLLSFYGTRQLMANASDHFIPMRLLFVWLQCLLVTSLYYLFYRVNHYYLVNKIYKQKGLIYYLFSLAATMMLFYIPLILLYWYLPAYKSILRLLNSDHWIGENAPLSFWAMYSGLSEGFVYIAVPLTLLIQWIQQSNKIEVLHKEKLDTELSLLKQQINPHFFFNTLNNVYAMSLTKDEKTPESILQLSDLMRYVIYKGQESTVALKEEIDYINDYLELQRLRLHQNFDLRFHQSVDDDQLQVTPLLFIILIENAFKHGIEGSDQDSFLHLSLLQNEHKLVFSSVNSIHDKTELSAKGVGMKNLKRRLELLYPDKHLLEIEIGTKFYSTTLTLFLTPELIKI